MQTGRSRSGQKRPDCRKTLLLQYTRKNITVVSKHRSDCFKLYRRWEYIRDGSVAGGYAAQLGHSGKIENFWKNPTSTILFTQNNVHFTRKCFEQSIYSKHIPPTTENAINCSQN